jgi:BirA family transcriptional regulator, biotin operon repressor / biotin---[acetyl-CoA-carboxylase] ligase
VTGPLHGEQAIPSQKGPFANGGHHVRLDQVDSTNRYAMEEAARGAPEGLVVVADVQTAGRGRLGRHWIAPSGAAVLCSLLFRPRLAARDLHLLPTVVALAARRACDDVAGVKVSLKWPNDLLAGGRKLAGILAESDSRAVVVGIGINVSWSPDEGSTSLQREAGHPVDRDAVLDRFLGAVDELYRPVSVGASRRGYMAVMNGYRQACSTVGARVQVDLLDESFTGTALDVTDDGCLLVATRACVRTVEAGDVVHLRPG